MKPWQIAAIALVVLLVVVALSAYAWIQIGSVEMTWIGVLAMVGGVVATLGLGGGLMALVFYSSRHGYDDDAGH